MPNAATTHNRSNKENIAMEFSCILHNLIVEILRDDFPIYIDKLKCQRIAKVEFPK